ncbi:N-terminal double-transmembrane domain-containing protein OS=Singulisphaera acidiphila (strain ATCC BAA-1392 / DSM 18658 / VKM B-2454 / MOB10) GN=Sinac_0403 PE=4 SV=1: BatA: VWA_2 [Gemmata massiliana]|uniref:VWFA domain-containing protein n=1 Tax=Gemmata massiliana TaxID=1210884 RepID=A0A6P2D6Y5_9BACT|nr:BatA and WFA domain-containing protein [Gemmata massiliana]VTR96225.1 N-terminal double-transmembrane domain-containing protein OS=Singulisphaera acidiphila (strain ATCC BAA-1392 / DSM 18658 / VKM B-2454 / MOB10) GN=Sinac_0403 PE=4 SV=1: BatA: VWA_2 [Gemmata massiliana]
MSFLAPLYALGLLAVAAPIVFHLIRRRPKDEVPFSSLMFLSPSPPPPASRRRLDQVLLLLLRASALILLGLAFMRPFFRQEAAAAGGEQGNCVVVLIDTSASMRRGDLWARAVAHADAVLADCKPTDRVAVYAFDRTVRPVLGFTESDHLEPHQRAVVARERVGRLTPTWGGTELGRALVDATTAILEVGATEKAPRSKIVLVSDLQRGARLTELAGFEWPPSVELELRTVADEQGNAGLSLLTDRAESERGNQSALRVRVTNEAGAKQERFRLAWSGTTGADIEAYVPPGESRVVKVPRPPAGPTPVLRLQGDVHDFDNAVHVAGSRRQELTVFFLGVDSPTDPAGLLYFLERAWDETPDRAVRVVARKPDGPLTADEVRTAPLVVLAGAPSAETVGVLDKYLRDGGTVLTVLATPRPLPALAGAEPKPVEEAALERYAMLRDIAFDHPLFAALSGPQFSDFTKVHFWKHRRVTEPHLTGARILARFDDGDPAVLEKAVGRGRFVVFTSGWQPADSQLARSSKFVPMLTGLLELRAGRATVDTNYRIGDRVPLQPASAVTDVRKPDGSTAALAPEATSFDGTDQPGVYTLETAAGLRTFAVNLDPAESLTAPLPVETLEQFGCRLAKRGADDQRAAIERQQRNAELERNQAIWRILILAAVAVLLVETGLAGWRTRSGRQEGATP